MQQCEYEIKIITNDVIGGGGMPHGSTLHMVTHARSTITIQLK